MTRNTLSQTLTALAEGALPAHPAITVTEAEIALPLIVSLAQGGDGPVLTATPPLSRVSTDFDPVAHRARMTFHTVPHPDAEPQRNHATGQDRRA